MNETPDLKIRKMPKSPFWLLYLVLMAAAYWIVSVATHPVSDTVWIIAGSLVALAAILCALPYYWDYQAAGRLVDVDAVTSVAEQMNDIKKYSAQISAATDQWARVQETTKGNAEKTVAASAK